MSLALVVALAGVASSLFDDFPIAGCTTTCGKKVFHKERSDDDGPNSCRKDCLCSDGDLVCGRPKGSCLGPQPQCDSVTCEMLPAVLESSTFVKMSVSYTAGSSRLVVVAIRNKDGWLGSGRTVVEAGAGTATVGLKLRRAPLPGDDYSWKVSIRPIGSKASANINVCRKKVEVVRPPSPLPGFPFDFCYTTCGKAVFHGERSDDDGSNSCRKECLCSNGDLVCGRAEGSCTGMQPACDSVNCASLPQVLESSPSLSVPVNYTASGKRDVVVAIRNKDGWLGSGRTVVEAGAGAATVDLKLRRAPLPGDDYSWKVSLRPSGEATNFQVCRTRGVEVVRPPSPLPGFPFDFCYTACGKAVFHGERADNDGPDSCHKDCLCSNGDLVCGSGPPARCPRGDSC